LGACRVIFRGVLLFKLNERWFPYAAWSVGDTSDVGEMLQVHKLLNQMPNQNILVALLLLFSMTGFTTVGSAQDSSPNKWTSSDGRELTADFVRLTEDSVVLRLSDGREAKVGLSSLSLDSHLQAVKLANPAAFSKPLPKAEIKQEIKVEIPKLSLNVDEMLRSPFPSNPTIEQFLDILQREHAAGNFFVDWHAIPPKMQSDIEDLLVKSVEVVGPTTVNQIRILLRDLNTIVQDKQEFILAHPMVASQPQLVAQLEKHWPLLTGTVGAFTQEDLWSPDNFQKGKVIPWLAKFAATVTPYTMAVLETAKGELPPGIQIPDPTAIEYKIVSQSADTAEVEVTAAGLPPQQLRYQKVGNIWLVPKQMNETRKGLDTAMEQLAKGAGQEMTMVRTGLAAVIAAVGGLARSNTQQEFDQAVDNLVVMVQGMAPNMGGPMGGGQGRGGPGLGAAPGGRSGGPGVGPGAGPGGRSGGPGIGPGAGPGSGPGGSPGGRRGGGGGPPGIAPNSG
jgi:hypothetical protein